VTSIFVENGMLRDILLGAIGSAVAAALVFVVAWAFKVLLGGFRKRVLFGWLLFMPFSTKIIIISILVFLFQATWMLFSLPYFHVVFVITCLNLLIGYWIILHPLSGIGIYGADMSVQQGVDYTQALKLCQNQIEFFGTGAAKLTENSEFEPAVQRCSRAGRPMKFLLAKPDNPILNRAARQANCDPHEYKNKVISSLRKLYSLQKKNMYNIEIRFYRSDRQIDYPYFRLMFIDDTICLVSYNEYGKGTGSQFPQLHLKSFSHQRRRQDFSSFFWPYQRYFNDIWEEAECCDLEEFISGE